MAKHSKYRVKYSSYHGRRNGTKLVALLLIVVIVASIGYLIWGDHTLSLSIFPRFDHESEQPQEEAPPEVELIIDDPQPAKPDVVVAPQESGLLLSTDVSTWTTQDLTGFDALAVTVKDSTGTLYYPVSLSDEVTVDGNATANAQALGDLLALDTHTMAWMSVLQDPAYGRHYVTASALMSDRGFGYKDEHSAVWLDPGKENTVHYATALVAQWIALGFDEIVLTDFHYPQTGDLTTIRYASDDPTQALTDLLVALHAQTQDAGVELGLVMSPGALVSGSVPYQDWIQYVDTFYAQTKDLPTAQSLVNDAHLVTLGEQVPVSGDYLLTP